MRTKAKRKNGESVSPVIATILMVAITVVLAAVLYVLVSGLLQFGDKPKIIAIACVKNSPTNFRCEIASADQGADFARVNGQVVFDAEVVASWTAPITFPGGGGNASAGGVAPPLAAAKILDNGDGKFGVGDTFYLTAAAGRSLAGAVVKLSGDGGTGSTTIP